MDLKKQNKLILVIDNNTDERLSLKEIIQEEYDVIEASSGEEAFELITKKHKEIYTIIVTLLLSDMDGYEVIRRLKANSDYSLIPVIISTSLDDDKSHEKAIAYGANALIMKPYNRKIVYHTLHDVIKLYESTFIVDALKRDSLTGLLNRDSFFIEAEKRIKKHEPGYFIISYFNVESFKVINDQYGNEIGDLVIKHIASTMNDFISQIDGLSSHIIDDKFAVLYPANMKDSSLLLNNHNEVAKPKCLKHKIRFHIGRYLIDDISLSIRTMFYRASFAYESIKGRYDVYIADYSEEMRKKIIHEQQIVNDMNDALSNGQFEPWFQPQYNHVTKAMIGVEALVRLKQNGKYIPPSEFIPIFEKNGFIYDMDKYIWREVCRLIRKWIDGGYVPLPVSVNISRVDFYHDSFIDTLTNIVDEFSIPHDLLRLEITESAFTDSNNTIITKVNKLVDLGFTIEIDDFGSEYSSLNTLQDVKAQVFKLDMRFFEKEDFTERRGIIIESVVRLGKWLGMSVIAEGVEDIEYADYLKSIGCHYIQGYLYAKPMPVNEYETLLRTPNKESRVSALKTIKSLNNEKFWNPDSMDTLIFNSYVGGACIFEYYNGTLELLRVNDQYAHELGNYRLENDIIYENQLDETSLDKENLQKLYDNVHKAIESKKESTIELVITNKHNPKLIEYIRTTVRVVAISGDRYLFYCVVVNVSEQRKAEKKEKILASRLRAIMENTKAGITAIVLKPHGEVEYLIVNDRYYELLGYTKEQYYNEVKNPFDLIIEDERDKIVSTLHSLKEIGQTATVEMRIRKRDGSIIWLRDDIATIKFEDIEYPIQLSNFIDVTDKASAVEKEKKIRAQLEVIMKNIKSGVTAITVKNNKIEYILVNETYYEQLGYTKDEFNKEITDEFLPIVPSEREEIRRQFNECLNENKPHTFEYHIKRKDGDIRVIQCILTKTHLPEIEDSVYLGVYNDITVLRETEKDLIGTNSKLKAIIENIWSGIAVSERKPTGLELLFANTRYYEMFKLDSKSDVNLIDYFSHTYINDYNMVLEEITKERVLGLKNEFIFRILNKDKTISWIKALVVASRVEGYDYPLHLYVFTDITIEKEAEYDLRLSEEEYRLATYLTGSIIGRYDIKKRCITIVKEIAERFELDTVINDVPYGRIKAGLISKDTEFNYKNLFEDIMHGKKEGNAIHQQKMKNGWRWLSTHYLTVFSDDGEPVSAIIEYHDVTKEIEKEVIYKKWENSLFGRDPNSYSLFCSDLSKGISFDVMRGKLIAFDDFITNDISFDERTLEYANKYVYQNDRKEYIKTLKSKKLKEDFHNNIYTHVYEYRELLPNHDTRWIRRTIELVSRSDENGILVYLMFENIDEQKKHELNIEMQATTDQLTGLLNRTAFKHITEKYLYQKNNNIADVIMIMDLDNFKRINDTFGHTIGDKALIEVSQVLRSLVRKEDYICRLGGDEFMIFLSDIESKEIISKKAQQICDAIRTKLSPQYQTSMSIGIALYPYDGETFDELYKNADKALYQTKNTGKNNYCFYKNK